jgi:hypothetical protein
MSEDIEKDMQDMQGSITEEDIKYRQGRSKYRVEATEKFAFLTIMICILIMGVLIWLNQCI